MKLATKIFLSLIGVLALAVLSSVVALLSARHIGSLMQNLVTGDLSSVRAAEELEIALLDQQGFVSLYILDGGNRSWLEELNSKKPNFVYWLTQARESAHTPEEREILDRIDEVYQKFNMKRDEVVIFYEKGDAEKAKAILLSDVNSLNEQVYQLCEDFIVANECYIDSRIADGRNQIKRISVMVGMSVAFTIGLGAGLLLLFFRGVLIPLRRMAEDASIFTIESHQLGSYTSPKDELRAVGFYLRALMSNVTETRSHLERSRAQLMNAEKLASVGKLAASVAHEIRNPLTSLKMRLFSLRRAVGNNPQYQDDFRVISEEITRLENVIRNFLEFSRPPELKLRAHSVSLLIDKTLELVGYSLKEKNIKLVRGDETGLPRVTVDSEQIKQVFINLLRNSMEALTERGEIRISADLASDKDNRPMVVVRFKDNGSGIPEDVRDQIFQPFFSTKEDGTGLGLCIAAHIMARHGGRIELESSTNQGTTFAVWIPTTQELNNEQNTGS